MDLTKLKNFQEHWVGREFKCMKTGETGKIPAGVYFGDIVTIGQGYIDVGDGIVCRWCGVTEVTHSRLKKRDYNDTDDN